MARACARAGPRAGAGNTERRNAGKGESSAVCIWCCCFVRKHWTRMPTSVYARCVALGDTETPPFVEKCLFIVYTELTNASD